jgi:hypothetical protein
MKKTRTNLRRTIVIHYHHHKPNLLVLFEILEGREGERFGGREIERKFKKSFTFFEKIFFIENDK